MPATTRRLLWFFGIAGSSALLAAGVSMLLRWLLLH